VGFHLEELSSSRSHCFFPRPQELYMTVIY
jgi:hypothetical protein